MKRGMMLFIAAGLAVALVAGCTNKTATTSDNGGAGTRSASSQAGNGAVGGGQASGDMRQRFAEFQEQHKYTFQLMRMAGNIGKLDEAQAPLTKAQAKQVLAVLQPLRAKETLTQDEAKEALKGLKKVLTEKQLNKIAAMKQPERRGGGMGGNRARTEGGRAPGGQRPPRMDPNAMKNFNPFNTDSPMGARGRERWDETFKALEAKAGK